MAPPTKRTKELCDAICHGLIEGRSLRSICRDEGMPPAPTVCRWLSEDDAFREQYAHAREAQADTLFDEILDIADDGSNDWMTRNGKDEDEGWQANGEHLQRSKLRVDARKWMAGKMRPKKYGDRVAMDHSGSMDVTLNVSKEDAEL